MNIFFPPFLTRTLLALALGSFVGSAWCAEWMRADAEGRYFVSKVIQQKRDKGKYQTVFFPSPVLIGERIVRTPSGCAKETRALASSREVVINGEVIAAPTVRVDRGPIKCPAAGAALSVSDDPALVLHGEEVWFVAKTTDQSGNGFSTFTTDVSFVFVGTRTLPLGKECRERQTRLEGMEEFLSPQGAPLEAPNLSTQEKTVACH